MFNFKFIIQRLPYYIVLSVGVNMFCAVLGMVIFEDSDDHLLKWVKFRIISIIICICFYTLKII